MTQTDNLKLNKFEGTDPLDYRKLNENSDILDGAVSRHNLLDNSNFLNPVNQRGATSKSITGVEFFIDRWYCKSVDMSIEDFGMRCVFGVATDWGFFNQRMENPSSYASKTLALSLKYRLTGASLNFGMFTSDNGIQATADARMFCGVKLVADGEWHIAKCTCTVPTLANEATVLETGIWVGYGNLTEGEWTPAPDVTHEPTTVATTLDLEWIKAEYGSEPTAYEAPNYQTERLKCERYFIKFVTAPWFNGFIDYNMKASFVIPVPAIMRTNPSISGELKRLLCNGVEINNLSISGLTSARRQGTEVVGVTTGAVSTNTQLRNHSCALSFDTGFELLAEL